MATSWLAIDWEQDPPANDRLEGARGKLRFKFGGRLGSLDEFALILGDKGARSLHARFAVRGVDECARWFLSRNRFDELGLPSLLLTSDGVRDACPEIAANEWLPDRWFRPLDPLAFEASLAVVVYRPAGRVPAVQWSGQEALDFARRIRVEAFEDRFDDVRILESTAAWSAWLRDVDDWVQTWIVVDMVRQDLPLLSATGGT